MSTTLRMVLIIGIVCYFILILYFLKKKMLHLRYTLLWIFAGVVLAIMAICPSVLAWFVIKLGIASNMNGLFLLLIATTLMIEMSLTAIISKQADKIKNLTQTVAKIEKRVRELEKE